MSFKLLENYFLWALIVAVLGFGVFLFLRAPGPPWKVVGGLQEERVEVPALSRGRILLVYQNNQFRFFYLWDSRLDRCFAVFNSYSGAAMIPASCEGLRVDAASSEDSSVTLPLEGF